jgi:hypothetical protein
MKWAARERIVIWLSLANVQAYRSLTVAANVATGFHTNSPDGIDLDQHFQGDEP